jgi:molybdate/tungstate transport system substrate-binding protein
MVCAVMLLSGGGMPLPGASGAAVLHVLYAGSLVNLVEEGLAPAFREQTHLAVEGLPGGSVALAHMILDRLRRADVFISADPEVNHLLMRPGPGPSAPWFFTLARNTLVVAYDPRSKFASALGHSAAGHAPGGRPWHEILARPGFRLGRTDPQLDPKGYRTILMLRLAEHYYHRADLEQRIIGSPENPRQIFPEEELMGRLESGQLDAGIFYLNEAVEHHLPYVTLPDEINLGNPAMASAYAHATYRLPTGEVRRGAPIVYTVTIPSTADNVAGAIRFVQFLYGPGGRAALTAHGLLPAPPLAGGDVREVPPALKPLITGSYGG